MALTTIVNGLTAANHCSAAGIESVGTNADEMKVSGKTAMKPSELAASGEETSIPSSANTHENAYPNSSRTPKPAMPSSALAWNEKPMISPVVRSTVIEMQFVKTSES